MFVFAFAETLFELTYTTPAFAFALLFERPRTRHSGFSTFFIGVPRIALCRFALRAFQFTGEWGGQKMPADALRFRLRFFDFSEEAEPPPVERARERRDAVRVDEHDTRERVRVVVRTTQDEAFTHL